MIVICTCVHFAQDKLHGLQRRVANPRKGGDTVRCTVCKKEIRVKDKEPTKPAEVKK